jgi:hypothetical protein
MKVARLKEILNDYKDEDYVFVALYAKDEADDYIESQDIEGEEIAPLNNEEWGEVVDYLDRDEGIWSEINNSWSYYIDKQITKRKGNNGNHQ